MKGVSLSEHMRSFDFLTSFAAAEFFLEQFEGRFAF